MQRKKYESVTYLLYIKGWGCCYYNYPYEVVDGVCIERWGQSIDLCREVRYPPGFAFVISLALLGYISFYYVFIIYIKLYILLVYPPRFAR